MKITKGNIITITKRKAPPYLQPFYKVGNRYIVEEGNEKHPDHIYLRNTLFKAKRTKMTLKFYDIRLVKHEEAHKIQRDFVVEQLNKKMQRTLDNDDHTVIVFRPLVAQLVALHWADQTRWAAIQHSLNFKKASRIINELKKQFDRLQVRDYKLSSDYDGCKSRIVKWYTQDHKWDKIQMYRKCEKVAKKYYPNEKFPDVPANAIAALVAVQVYRECCTDARNRLREKMPDIGEYAPLEMINTTLPICMLGYLPDIDFNIKHAYLDDCLKNLYHQIQEVAFETYESESA